VNDSAISAACGPYCRSWGDERQHDGDEDERRDRGIDHPEIHEPEQAHDDDADQVHFFAADLIGEMAGKRDGEERHARRHHHGREDQVPRHMQGTDRVSEDEGGKDVERRLLGHPQQK
jgi:hypothetical protein